VKPSAAILIILLISICSVFGQQIDNVWVKVSDNSLILSYNLETENPDDVFDIQVYSSFDGFKEPLSLVEGDVGSGIKSGEDKQIIWRLFDELGENNLELRIEIRAVVHSPFVTFQNIGSDLKVRRGTNFRLDWEGGDLNQIFSIELLSDENTISHIGNTLNNQFYDWKVPTNLDLDKPLKIKIVDINNPRNFSISNPFQIKRKIPWVYRVGVFVIVTSLSTWRLLSKDKNKDIPDPPDPPNNN